MARTLDEWVEYIQTLHARAIDLGLERVSLVWKRFRPDTLPTVITIAGTNGKGSSVSMLESVYRHAGYTTASFTSPHLVSFNERIRLNNEPVSDAELLEAFERIEVLREDTSLTFFEYNTLVALDIFCRNHADVWLLEVGMGGRLDAVNIVRNDLALITAIGLDHTAWLGDDLEQIGAEKGGVIKAQGRAVLADPDAPKSLVDCADRQQASYVQAGVDFVIEDQVPGPARFRSVHRKLQQFDSIQLSSTQAHVRQNTAGVIASIAMLSNTLAVSSEQVRRGLSRQQLRGRLELIDGAPAILLDVSHNEASVLAMLAFIESLPFKGRLHAVFGALGDKNYGRAYGLLKDRVARWYLCSLAGDRGQSASQLSERLFGETSLATLQESVFLFDSPRAAYRSAITEIARDDLLVIFGSFHVVGDIIPLLKN